MNGQHFAVVVVVLLVGAGALALPTAGTPTTALESGAPADQGTAAANGTSMGSRISSFMQSSAAQTEGDVESGMWEARFEGAPHDRRAALVSQRARSLEERLQRLESERAALLDGDDVTLADRARAARLTAQAAALRDAINGTAVAADRTGVNVTALDELRTRARNVSGGEVSEMAPGVGPGGPPPGLDAGPQTDGPGDGEAGDGTGSATTGVTDVPGGGQVTRGTPPVTTTAPTERGDADSGSATTGTATVVERVVDAVTSATSASDASGGDGGATVPGNLLTS
ncbi:MAG: hypothetical protein ABEJ06_04075 [Haloarculaceae archaeon]